MLLHEIYAEGLRKTPDKPAIIVDGQSLSYRMLDDLSQLWARAMLGLGVRRGDRISILMPNRVEYMPLYFACYRIGAIACPLSYQRQTAADEVAFALNLTGSRFLFMNREYQPGLKGIKSLAPSLEREFVMEDTDDERSWLRLARLAPADVKWPQVWESDPALIAFTSGSTDRPKGVTHTHSSICHTIINKSKTYRLDSSDIYLIGTMFFHLSGGVAFSLPALLKGGTIILMKHWTPEGFLDLIEKRRATHVAAPSGQVREIVAQSRARKMDWRSVKTFTSGGDALTMCLLKTFYEITGFEIVQNYGLTECEGFCTNPPYGKIKRGSIGLPTYGTRMRLIDSEGRDVPRGQTGEMIVQSKGVMAGYWGDPAKTAKAFIDGWLRTGDLARQDEDGYFFFVGRIKNIIVKGGTRIAPPEVEEAISVHPSVEACGVVGESDPVLGQVIHAFVVLKSNPEAARTTADELASFVGRRLPRLEVPDRWTFVPELPRTTLEKIDRKLLAAFSGGEKAS